MSESYDHKFHAGGAEDLRRIERHELVRSERPLWRRLLDHIRKMTIRPGLTGTDERLF